jgi:hypothetical protein
LCHAGIEELIEFEGLFTTRILYYYYRKEYHWKKECESTFESTLKSVPDFGILTLLSLNNYEVQAHVYVSVPEMRPPLCGELEDCALNIRARSCT